VELASLFLLSGAFMGWSVGTNDASNVFGTAVGTRVVRFRTAIWLTAVFAIFGAAISGQNVIGTVGVYAAANAVNSGVAAFIVMLVAATIVTFMSVMKAPVSTSQCIVGAIVGWGLSQGSADWSRTIGFFSAWVISPIATMFVSLGLCVIAQRYIEARVKGLAAYDSFIKWGYIIAGCFGAYSMGANNAANATGIYLHVGIFNGPVAALNSILPFNVTIPFIAALIGGITIALGTLTFSKRVMLAVGEGIVKLSPLQGFLVVLASSLTMFVFSLDFIGISISTSQAVVGAVMGAGFSKGHRGLDFKVLGRIFIAWFGTPTIAGLVSFAIGSIFFR
jgi:PiT family inorganic phosphate transporter